MEILSDIGLRNVSRPFFLKFKSLPLLCFALFVLTFMTTGQAQLEPTAPIPTTKELPSKSMNKSFNGLSPQPEVKAKVETFLATLAKQDIPKAFDTLLQGTRLSSREENVKVLIDQTQHALTLYGKMGEFEALDTYQVGSRVLITTYLTALQTQPLRWRFVYYKADQNWLLIDLRVDDSMTDLIER